VRIISPCLLVCLEQEPYGIHAHFHACAKCTVSNKELVTLACMQGLWMKQQYRSALTARCIFATHFETILSLPRAQRYTLPQFIQPTKHTRRRRFTSRVLELTLC
jgi:hypothetical protein